MAHKEEWARRLWRELPADPSVVLSRIGTYADATFMRFFLQDLDNQIYNDPQKALKWAKIAPTLALAVPKTAGLKGCQEHHSRLVLAWVVLGSAYRAASEHTNSDRTYEHALRLIESESIPSLVQVDYYRRLSTLRACQKKHDEALALADVAVELLRTVDDNKARARALIARGYALATVERFSEAGDCFGEALTMAGNPDKGSAADQRLHRSICHNLAQSINDQAHVNSADFNLFFAYLRKARAEVKGGRRSVARYRLLWVEGLLWAKIGTHSRAEKAFKVALEGFQALRLPFEIALVSLDLGAIYHHNGEWSKLEILATATYRLFRLLAADTESIAALSLWMDAARMRTLTDDLTIRTRQTIEARIGPGGCCLKRSKRIT